MLVSITLGFEHLLSQRNSWNIIEDVLLVCNKVLEIWFSYWGSIIAMHKCFFFTQKYLFPKTPRNIFTVIKSYFEIKIEMPWIYTCRFWKLNFHPEINEILKKKKHYFEKIMFLKISLTSFHKKPKQKYLEIWMRLSCSCARRLWKFNFILRVK